MAGESPDRSEQQQSSGETTPGESSVPTKPTAPPRPVEDPRTRYFERSGEAADSDSDNDSEESTSEGREPAGTTARAESTSPDEAEETDEAPERHAATSADGATKPTGATPESPAPAPPSANHENATENDADDEGAENDIDGDSEDGEEQPDRAKPAKAEADEPDEPDEPDSAPDESDSSDRAEATPSAADQPDRAATSEPDEPEPNASGQNEPEPETSDSDEADPDATDPDKKDSAASATGSSDSAGDDATESTSAKGTAEAVKPSAAAKAASEPETGSDPESAAEPKTPSDKTAPAKPAPAAKAEPPAAGRSSGAESDSERTSRFVPLRSPDEGPAPSAPTVSTPLPPAGAPPAGPPPSLEEAERTRQQLLPPVPGQRPLDLLAELTNKPAPPETPVRTLVRRVKIWTPLLLLLVLFVIGAQLLRPLPSPELALTAQATHTFDGEKPAIAWPDSGQAALEVDGLGSLGTYGEQKPVPIASVAKTMTAYLMLRDHPMKAGADGAKITVDKQAEEDAGLSAQGESTVDVREGETLTQREALNAVMIASANNVARLVARWDSGSEKAFVEKMNKAAEELGMKNTTYTDPSGLRKETVSTAEDQVKLGKAVMKLEAFRESVRLPSYQDRNGKQQNNWNRLVPAYSTIGIKTGTTTAAGGNLLFAAEKEVGGTKQLIIGAVLSQHQPPIIDSVLSAGKDLILSAQDALESELIIKKGTVVGAVDDQLGGRTDLVVTEDVTAVGWPGLKVELELAESAKGVPHTAKAGARVGNLTVGSGPGQVKVPVALDAELTEPSTSARLTRVS